MTNVPLSDFDYVELVDYFAYLDRLRSSGETNMFGAGSWLREEHGLSRDEAAAVLRGWMKTFDGNKHVEDRAEEAQTASAAA